MRKEKLHNVYLHQMLLGECLGDKIVGTGEVINANSNLVGNRAWKRPLERPKRSLEYKLKWVLIK